MMSLIEYKDFKYYDAIDDDCCENDRLVIRDEKESPYLMFESTDGMWVCLDKEQVENMIGVLSEWVAKQ